MTCIITVRLLQDNIFKAGKKFDNGRSFYSTEICPMKVMCLFSRLQAVKAEFAEFAASKDAGTLQTAGTPGNAS